MGENKIREDIEHKIIADETLLQICDNENWSYQWQLRIMKFLTDLITYNFNYEEPWSNTVVPELRGKNIPHSDIKVISVLWLMVHP